MFSSLTRNKNFQVLNRLTSINRKLSNADSSLVRYEPKLKDLEENDRCRINLPFKKYFIENLFLNNFQADILEYPEISTLKEVKSLERSAVIAKNCLVCKADSEELVYRKESEKVVSTLKNLELTGFKLPLKCNGFGYLDSEFLFMSETLSKDLSLAKAVAENENTGVYLINTFGSSFLKEKYLPKLATGESITCFAHLEAGPSVGLNPITVNTTALESSDGQSYIVSGKKIWVYNATHADTIIFSANVTSVNVKEGAKANPTLFVVDKNLEGIMVHEPIKTLGMNGVDICEVSFNNVVVPSVSVLGKINEGDELIKRTTSKEKLSNSTQCITLMKKLLKITVDHCISTKFFNKNKYERSYFQLLVANIVNKLYSVESMTYLLSGRLDSFHEADVFLESFILKIVASENLQHTLQQTLSVLGTDFYSQSDCMEEIIRDSQFYTACNESNDYCRLVLSTAGCKHVLKYRNEKNFFKKFRDALKRENINKQLGCDGQLHKGVLEGYLHLMFEREGRMIEDCVFRLKQTVNYLFKQYGENIFEKKLELKFLADLVIKIYTMTAIAGRASRSYCLALNGHEVDRVIAQAEIGFLYYQFEYIETFIKNKSMFRNSEIVSTKLMTNKNYAENYPLFTLFARNG